tara:strand:+ start:2710 stop:3666 length:957 start_codon:yes stop_codon:yes gene_type:complete
MSTSKTSKGLGRGLTDMPHYKDNYSSEANQKHPLFRRPEDLEGNFEFKSTPRIIGKMAGDIALIPIGQIQPNNDQPRIDFNKKSLQKLATSIEEIGIIQPITVRKLSALKYQIISGERRFRASQIAGLYELPAYIREADDQKLLEMALVENVQREDLHPIEIAISYQRLIAECNLSHKELGKLVGKSRSSISNQLRLLELPEEIQIALVTKKLSQGHAKALLAMADNPEQQMILFSLIKDENISVRLAEEISRKGKRKKKRTKPTYSLSDDQSQALDMIKLRFSQKVKLIKTSNKTGKIEIRFDSNEELESFLIKLTN